MQKNLKTNIPSQRGSWPRCVLCDSVVNYCSCRVWKLSVQETKLQNDSNTGEIALCNSV